MPRKKGLPAYRHHRPSGRAVVTVSDRDFYLGPWNSNVSRAEYDRLIGEWLANGRRLPEETEKFTMNVNELILRYWEFCRTYYRKDDKPTSEQNAIRLCLKVVRRLYGRQLARDFGPLALKTCREKYLAADQSRQKINQNTGRIRRMFKWGVENEFVPPSVIHGLQAVTGLRKGRTEAKENQPVRPVEEERIEAVLPHVPPMIATMIRVQLFTGMRPGELVLMRGDEIDTEGKIWLYRPESHKTAHHGHQRAVHIGPKAQWILRPWLKEAGDGFVFSPRRSEEKRNAEKRKKRRTPMTPSQSRRRPKQGRKRAPREHYNTQSYCRAIRRACEKAGVPSWHPHQLRHNAATNIRKEFGIEAARVVLGHRSPLVTEIYAEIDQAKAAQVMEAVG